MLGVFLRYLFVFVAYFVIAGLIIYCIYAELFALLFVFVCAIIVVFAMFRIYPQPSGNFGACDKAPKGARKLFISKLKA